LIMNLLFALVLYAHAAPRITPVAGQVGVPTLTAPVEAALAKANPDFKMFTADDYLPSVKMLFLNLRDETPMAIVGDFNGDGQKDIVVMGHARNERLVYAVISVKNGYVAQLVDREALDDRPLYPAMAELGEEFDADQEAAFRESGQDTYLSLQPANDREPGVKAFKLDTLILETFRADSRVFPYVDGSFHEWEPTVARGSATSR